VSISSKYFPLVIFRYGRCNYCSLVTGKDPTALFPGTSIGTKRRLLKQVKQFLNIIIFKIEKCINVKTVCRSWEFCGVQQGRGGHLGALAPWWWILRYGTSKKKEVSKRLETVSNRIGLCSYTRVHVLMLF
jgi:hypothetical protein